MPTRAYRRSLSRKSPKKDPPPYLPWTVAHWLDQPGNATAVSGSGQITSLVDITGNAKNLTGATVPTYQANSSTLGGRAAARGDGSAATMATGTISVSQTFSMVFIGTWPSDNRTAISGRAGAGSGNLAMIQRVGAGWKLYAGAYSSVFGAGVSPALVAGVFAGASSIGIENESVTTSLNPSTAGCDTLRIMSYSGAEAFYDGDMAFCGIMTGDVTAHPNWPLFRRWAYRNYGIAAY